MPATERPHINRPRIEIIPLIDVIFFLLATFVLFTLSLNRIQSFDLDLPQVPVPPVPAAEVLTIRVTNHEAVVWGNETIPLDQLPARLAAYQRLQADPRILVTGDRDTPFGSAVHVLDQVRVSGIRKVSVRTDQR